MSVDMIIINLRISFLSISQIWMICQAGNQFSVAALAKLLFHTSDKQVIKSQSYFIMKKTSATTNLTSDEWRILMFSEILSRVFLLFLESKMKYVTHICQTQLEDTEMRSGSVSRRLKT